MRTLLFVVTFSVLGCLGWNICTVGWTSTACQAANLTGQEVPADVQAQIQKLNSQVPRERAEATCALARARATSAIPALINLLADDTPIDQPVCGDRGNWGNDATPKTTPGEMAAVALAKIGKESVEPLISALSGSSSVARANAAFALGLIHDNRSVEPLIGATKDTVAHVRAKAVWSLGLVGDNRAVEPLANALKDSEAKVRSQAAWALGLKGDERSVEPLIAALGDESLKVQSQAAWALGLKGDQRAVEPLAAALHANNDHVRSQA